MAHISLIAAMTNNRVIGLNNTMPWHLPADLAHFKRKTSGKHVIMGRKTFESIGHALPNRTNIVLTRNKEWSASGVIVKACMDDAIQSAETDEEVIIIGGAALYQSALSKVDTMYLTFIDAEIAGDTFFPVWDKSLWREVERQSIPSCDKNPYACDFVTFKKSI